MHSSLRNLIYLSLFFGLITVLQVHAIDGDYSNPYATDPGGIPGDVNTSQFNTPQKWNGIIIYGGKNKELPFMTLVGASFLLLGIGIGSYCLIRERRQRNIG
jgi:hypothetical protein